MDAANAHMRLPSTQNQSPEKTLRATSISPLREASRQWQKQWIGAQTTAEEKSHRELTTNGDSRPLNRGKCGFCLLVYLPNYFTPHGELHLWVCALFAQVKCHTDMNLSHIHQFTPPQCRKRQPPAYRKWNTFLFFLVYSPLQIDGMQHWFSKGFFLLFEPISGRRLSRKKPGTFSNVSKYSWKYEILWLEMKQDLGLFFRLLNHFWLKLVSGQNGFPAWLSWNCHEKFHFHSQKHFRISLVQLQCH